MYKPSDVEILEAYDDYLLDMPDNDESIGGAAIWLEGFKRGMRFNTVASQPVVEADAQKPCPYCYRSGRAKYKFCYNCGLDLRPA